MREVWVEGAVDILNHWDGNLWEDCFVKNFVAEVIEGHDSLPEGVQLVLSVFPLPQEKPQQGCCGTLRIRQQLKMWDKSWYVLFGIFRKRLSVIPPRLDPPRSWRWGLVGKYPHRDPSPCSRDIWCWVSSFSLSTHPPHLACHDLPPLPLMWNVWQPCNRWHPCQIYHSTTTSHHCNQTAGESMKLILLTVWVWHDQLKLSCSRYSCPHDRHIFSLILNVRRFFSLMIF